MPNDTSSDNVQSNSDENSQVTSQVSTESVESEKSQPTVESPKVEVSQDAPKGKNARKKEKWKREGKLPREPLFGASATGTENASGKASSEPLKPFPFAQYRETARKHAKLFEGLLNAYFEKRGAVKVVQVPGGMLIRTMNCSDFGDITYYTDRKAGTVKGPIAEAIAFHLVVAGEGSISWVDGFIERHRSGVSMFMLIAGIVYIETAIRSNAELAAEIDRRTREASKQPVEVPASENAEIKVEAN